MAQILLSTGGSLATGLNPMTTRRVVEIGDAAVVTPGTTGFDVVQLLNPTLDSAFQAATSLAPIKLGIDNIRFVPLLYPESF
jgi:hypothetical protein